MDKNVDPFNGIKDMRLNSCGVFIRMKGGFYASGWWGKQAYCCILIFCGRRKGRSSGLGVVNPGLKNGFSLHSQGSAWTSGGLGSEGMVGYGFGRSGHGTLTETALLGFGLCG